MSNQLDEFFEQLRGQAPPAPFAPAAAVRRRGRQRANRQAVSVGVAVLAVTGLGAGSVVTLTGAPGPDPAPPAATSSRDTPEPAPTSPTSPPDPEPTRTEVPAPWLLTADDLGGAGWEPAGNELLEGEWYWDGAQAWCPEFRIEDYPSIRQRWDLGTVSWVRDGEAVPERVDQIVELFEPGAAQSNLADVRAYVQLCSRRGVDGDETAPTYYEVEETGFAGDESLLLRVEQYAFNEDDQIEPVGEFHRVAVVRVGDAVTTIVYQASADVRELAQRAAARMG
ncbi:MAG: hypothetical protein GEV12_13305 [Micromonosporaceae bacterium]|nr:hypothetical protein [Micromonosporaceae bacterium]